MYKTVYPYLPTIAISDYLYLKASITYHFISAASPSKCQFYTKRYGRNTAMRIPLSLIS